MKKEKYIAPSLEVVVIDAATFIAASPYSNGVKAYSGYSSDDKDTEKDSQWGIEETITEDDGTASIVVW